jgi:membrane fusion protein (multidrug efflux system)
MDKQKFTGMRQRQLIRRMIIMLGFVILIFGGIFGYQAYKRKTSGKYASAEPPPASVSAIKAEYSAWQPRLKAVGSLRASRGVDLSTEIAGIVRSVHFKSGDDVRKDELLIQLNDDADIALLHSLEAAADLAETVYERDKKQFEIHAVSKATLDSDEADLKSKRAQVAGQRAIIEKKSIQAPFDGRLGISAVNRGQYVNPGDRLVTLQSLDSILIDFYLPQQELSRIAVGQKADITTDVFPGRRFVAALTAINPKVDPDTRNVQVEAVISNPRHELLPGMYAEINVRAGKVQRHITLPQTAVTYNPYGDTVFIIRESTGPGGKQRLTVKQALVTTGPARGDQVAIMKGIKEGDTIATSGQLKLKNGSTVIINNQVQPSNEPAPKPQEE